MARQFTTLLLAVALAAAGCWHKSHSGSPPWPHILTCYGGCAPPHYDPTACGGSTACCSGCIDGTWWYSTEQQIFGCGAKLEIRRGNKCCVVQVADNGPASWVEDKAAVVCGGSGDIIDASPLVRDYLGGGCGWSECFMVQVRPVPSNYPQGICPTCPCGGECAPGQQQSKPCGNCGTSKRTCGSNSKWGGWGACQGQGPCAPGQGQTENCGDCGKHSRTCGGNCQWGGWNACAGPDPDGGNQVCDSGELGICADGRMRCLAGWLNCVALLDPYDELCDGLDNDCDGPTDEEYPQVMGDPPPPYAARLTDFSLPASLAPGEEALVWVDFLNLGTATWNPDDVWLKIEGAGGGGESAYFAPGQWPAWDIPAVLQQPVPPGGTARFEFYTKGPAAAGSAVEERLVLFDAAGNEMRCPEPDFSLAIPVLGEPAAGAEGALVETPDVEAPTTAEPPPDTRGDKAGCGLGRPGGAGVLWLLLLLAGLALLRRRRALLVATLAVGLGQGCVDEAPDHAFDPVDLDLATMSQPVSCNPGLDKYPVKGPHNGGWDPNALVFTCPPHPASSPDNSDWIGGDHYGNDIFAPKGAPIVAGRGGQIVKSGYTSVGGNRVTIRDGCGWYYYYAHLNSIAGVSWVGNTVSAGTVIGTNGNTGSAVGTAPHLHFSIYPDGCYNCGVNPFPYLQASDHTSCGECSPGQQQSQGCGNCGTKTRSCQGNGKWSGWSGCQGQGPCAPGQGQTEDCGDCGQHSRSCGGNCQWGGWGACAGPDPGGGTVDCDSGDLGVCAEGRMRCLAGWLKCVRLLDPSDELCDDLDNDCDGPVDEGSPEILGDPPPRFAAFLLDYSLPPALQPGEQARVWAEFLNVGTEPWAVGEIWLLAEGNADGPASAFFDAEEWEAWNIPAVLEKDVAPGAVGRVEFTVRAPSLPGPVAAERFSLLNPQGELMMCPKTYLEFALEVTGMPSPAAEAEALPDLAEDVTTTAPSAVESARPAAEGCSSGPADGTRGPASGLLLLAAAVLLALCRSYRTQAVQGVLLLSLALAGCSYFDSSTTSPPEEVTPEPEVEEGLAVLSLSPSSGSARGGVEVTVKGREFEEGMKVFFGEVEAVPAAFVDGAELTVVTPPMLAGTVDVTVELADGGSAVREGAFTVEALELRFVGVPPHSFPGLAVHDSRAAAAADFDGDGDPDLAVATFGPLHLLVNDGNGNFSDAPTGDDDSLLPVLIYDFTVALAADLHGDGAVDLVLGTGPGQPIALLVGDGEGRMVEPDEGALPDNADHVTALAAGDLNGDGVLDLVTANASADPGAPGWNRIYLSAKGFPGTYEAAPEEYLPQPEQATSAIALADLDGDSDLDLLAAAATAPDGVFLRLYPKALGAFTDAPSGLLPAPPGPVSHLVAEDLDGDGDVDFVAVCPAAQDRLYLNDGDAHFFDATAVGMPLDFADGEFAILEDLDLDGDFDLVIANNLYQNRLYLNDGAGRFLDYTPILPIRKDPSTAVLAADLDGDFDSDLLFLNSGGESNQFLLSVTPEVSP